MRPIPVLLLSVSLLLVASQGRAADKVKVGFISSLSNPSLAAGPELLDGFRLGIADAGASDRIELVVNDDQGKPDIGVQLARKMIDEDKVQIITGIVPSNIMLAVARSALPRKVFIVSVQAGPSELAGKECSPYFFAASDETDTASEGMGLYLNKAGKKKLYLVAANYAAGRDIVTGIKRSFKGSVIGETYTPLGQLDYAAELAEARAASPDSVFFFEQSGNASINFVKQYAEAGLKDKVPLYGVSTVIDEETLPGMGDAAVGLKSAGFWGANLDNPANRAMVAHFEAQHHRRPSVFTIFAYDGARLIDSAIRAVDGHVERADEFRAALKAAKFDSVRGKFRFNTNQFPIQNIYLLEVTRTASGALENNVTETMAEDYPDAYAGDCPMK
ncbi:MAG TPA: ABC transporter substrate-binding protein [Stellaceae bacterium]|nr:ABC transporter substrate-binding protein [Stellaceae bacterium]